MHRTNSSTFRSRPSEADPARAAASVRQSTSAGTPNPKPAVPGADMARRRHRIRAGGRLVAVLAGAAVLVTACHSSGSNDAAGNPSSSSSGAGSQTPSGPAYAQCMRQHGVTNFPDPQGPNQNSFLISGAVTRNPHFKSASQACQSLRPQQTGGAGGAGGLSQQKLLALAQCMRTHGVPNFPDPTSGGAVRIGGPGLDPTSPTFQHAMQVCQAKTGVQLGGGQ